MSPLVLLYLFVFNFLTTESSTSFEAILTEAKHLDPWILNVRRTLHQIPELMYNEVNTSTTVKSYLNSKDIEYRSPFAVTGVVASIGSGKPVVALRADMDALPVEEPEGLAYRSQNPGCMHACGHDAHMAMLLGAGALLKQHEAELQGTVKLIFQPAEEGGAGASVMIDEGALEGIDAVFGFHLMPHIPTGVVGTKAGTIMAGAYSFSVIVTGRGGHAAIPHNNIDPIVAAAALVGSLQTLVSRETSPLGSAVLSVTLFRAGDGAYNVIPDSAMFGGTIRGSSHAQLQVMRSRFEAMSASVAAAYGCTAEVDWREDDQKYYPPTVNDPAMASFALDVASKLFGPENAVETEALMAGEDFAFYAQTVPSAFVFLGIRNETLGSVHGLHNAKFMVDESVLHKGAALHAALAMEYLRQNHKDEVKEEL